MSRATSLLLALKANWGVSMQALYERAYHLGIVDQEHRAAFYKMLNTKRWRVKEPGDEMIAPEEPRLAPSIGASLRASGLSASEAMKLLGVTSPERVVSFGIEARDVRRSHLRAVN